MSYRTQAQMADDYHLHRRVAACAAGEGIPNPYEWAVKNAWTLSALPGWDAAYESAVLVGNETPGGTKNVITDGMILSGVQAVRDMPTS